MSYTHAIQLSNLDEQRFGVKTLKTVVESTQQLEDILEFCEKDHIPLCIIRIDTAQLDLAQKAEEQGFRLMDTLLYYKCHLQVVFEDEQKIHIVQATKEQASRIKDISRSVFHSYNGHYHADVRLDNAQCNEVYASWAESICLSEDSKDKMLCAVSGDGNIMGFGALRYVTKQVGDGVLFGVAPEYRHQGVYSALVVAALNDFKKAGCTHMTFSTQITNVVAQDVWVKLGFTLTHSVYTLHKWNIND